MRLRYLAFFLATSVSAQAPTNVRMQTVVKLFVQRTGQQLIGLGSWISGINYKDVLDKGASDHDLRLVIQKSGVSPAQAQREWQSARRVLQDLITQEFGKDAPKVLASTNLYAPNQLMKGVEDAAEAMQRFEQLGQVPNMGYSGKVTSATPQHLAEGLYGEGAQLWTQMYEQKSGRLFYAVDGRAYAGMVDLTHLAEGRGPYTVSGMANTGAQWAEKASEELAAGRGGRVAKYLERLERDLNKAKDLARLGGDPSWTNEIRDVTSRLKASPGALTNLEGRVSALLQRAHLESAILARLPKAGPVQGAVLQAAMAGIAAKNQFGQALSSAVQKIPATQLIHGVIAIIVVKSGSRALGESGYMEAIRQTAPVMASLGTGLLMGITNAIMDGAKEGGFSLAASYQDPWDLLDGNFSAYGREGIDDGRSYTLDDLVRAIHTEERLSAFVHTRADQASRRGFQGAVSTSTDKSVADAIYARCYPPIRLAWQVRREQLRMEYLDLADSLKTAVYPMVVTPSAGKLKKGEKLDVLAEVIPPKDGMLGKSLDRMKEILTLLVGGRPYALVTYRWAGGEEANRESQRRFTFRQPGTQLVECRVEISVNESSLRAGDPLIQRIGRFTAVDVDIDGELPVPKIEVFGISVNIRVEADGYGPTIPRYPTGAPKAQYIDLPDMIDSRSLPLAADGTFHYAGRPYFDKDAAPGTIVYGSTVWRIEYSGRVDLDRWTVAIAGKWSRNVKNYTSKWEVHFSQQDDGVFTIAAPLCARDVKLSNLFKVGGEVTLNYQDKQGGSVALKRPIASKSPRRQTDDVFACTVFRNPEYLNPEYKSLGGLDSYEGGETLERERYLALKPMIVFGNHVIDKSLFTFTRKGMIMPAAGTGASPAGQSIAPPAILPPPSPLPPPPPESAPAYVPAERPAPPANTLNGQGEMNGAFVSLTNAGKTHWTRCTITIPGKKSFTSGTLPASTGRDYALGQFKAAADAVDLQGEVLVQCLEGSLRFRAAP